MVGGTTIREETHLQGITGPTCPGQGSNHAKVVLAHSQHGFGGGLVAAQTLPATVLDANRPVDEAIVEGCFSTRVLDLKTN